MALRRRTPSITWIISRQHAWMMITYDADCFSLHSNDDYNEPKAQNFILKLVFEALKNS